jgi:protein SCO1/2/putative membrane protein
MRGYRRGIQTVLCTVLASALAASLFVGSQVQPQRAAQDLGDQAQDLGPFQLVERSGQAKSQRDLADRVCIFSFIFTRCQLSCPRISSLMKSLQSKLEGSSVLLVSLSVDPEHDSPAVLKDYASRFGAEPDRWWFLTGPRAEIYRLIRERFKLSVMENPGQLPEGKGETILHSDRLALVDHGRLVGLYDSTDASALEALIGQARRRALPDWVRTLPTVNASLNALCTLLLVAGWSFIRGVSSPRSFAGSSDQSAARPEKLLSLGRVRAHRTCMLLAVFTSALFLGSYLVYHFQARSVPYQGQGPVRWLYFTILLSHTVLATLGVVPLVLFTLVYAARGQFSRHRQIAAVTLPIWLYVSVTGVVVYLMLYQLPVPS